MRLTCSLGAVGLAAARFRCDGGRLWFAQPVRRIPSELALAASTSLDLSNCDDATAIENVSVVE